MITLNYNDFADSFKNALNEWCEENEVNPFKLIALALYASIPINEENETLKEFLDSVELDGYDDLRFTYDSSGREFDLFLPDELIREIESVRNDYIDDLKYNAPKQYEPYIDFEEMASDEIFDIYDCYPEAYVEQYEIDLENSPFKQHFERITVVEHEY